MAEEVFRFSIFLTTLTSLKKKTWVHVFATTDSLPFLQWPYPWGWQEPKPTTPSMLAIYKTFLFSCRFFSPPWALLVSTLQHANCCIKITLPPLMLAAKTARATSFSPAPTHIHLLIHLQCPLQTHLFFPALNDVQPLTTYVWLMQSSSPPMCPTMFPATHWCYPQWPNTTVAHAPTPLLLAHLHILPTHVCDAHQPQPTLAATGSSCFNLFATSQHHCSRMIVALKLLLAHHSPFLLTKYNFPLIVTTVHNSQLWLCFLA